MLDENIIELYWNRSENAISETAAKYGGYCYAVAHGILRNREDSEECVNDTYLRAWESMPDARPKDLKNFLGRITRNRALNKLDYRTAEKRGGSEIPIALDELADCLADPGRTDELIDRQAVREALEEFLPQLKERDRNIFIARYWFLCPVKEISEKFMLGESGVKSSLYRSRVKLKEILEKKGITV